jgi:predicted nucleic acid-binding protein
MANIPEIEILPDIEPLAESIVQLLQLLQLPPKAALDATHLAFAVIHRMDYLLTWNCTHLANVSLQKTLFEYCSYHHLHMPVIYTPELLTKPQL